jgi:hypothetical protein
MSQNINLQRTVEIINLLEQSRTNLARVERFGSDNDGGYLVVNDFTHQDFLISMGIGSNVDFESDISPLIKGLHMYDNSIESPPKTFNNGYFYKETIGNDGFTTISDAIDRVDGNQDLILKLDIEGSEWNALGDINEKKLLKFRQIIVEFHWFENILNQESYLQMLMVLKKLRSTHFNLNVHPNNHGDTLIIENLLIPSVLEVTYLRRTDYAIDESNYSLDLLLSELNKPCNPSVPEIIFPYKLDYDKFSLSSNPIGFYSRFNYDQLLKERDETMKELYSITNSNIWRFTSLYRRLRLKTSVALNQANSQLNKVARKLFEFVLKIFV